VGRRFSRAELDGLTPSNDASATTRHLQALAERGFVRPLEELFRFHHVLVRDVAYRGIPKAERAELHELAANGLDRRDGADELVGYHFEQAYRYRVELARADDHARELAAAGGERLGHAGIRAWKRADAPAAVNLLGRAVDLLPVGAAARRELLCELGVALRMRGDFERAEKVLREAAVEAVEEKDRRIELRAQIELGSVRAYGSADAGVEVAELASEAISELETFGDDRSLGRAWLLVGQIRGEFHGDNAALEDAAARAAVHYRRAGWSPSTSVSAIASALYYGPRPVEQGIARCEELLREHAGDRASEANIVVWLGGLEAMRGRFDDARSLVERAEGMYEELGQTLAAEDTCGLVEGTIEVLAGRLDVAEQALRKGCDACTRFNVSALLASRAAELADVLYSQLRYDEAETWIRISQECSGPDDRDAQSSWRGVAARLAAREGRLEDAERLAREALAIVEQTDALNHHGKLLLDLAEVLQVSDRDAEAATAIERAVADYQLKGNVIAAAQARQLLDGSAVVR
jgi:tetratricopeptide (TPR) repeat protein